MRADIIQLAVAFRNCFVNAPNNKNTSNFNAPRQHTKPFGQACIRKIPVLNTLHERVDAADTMDLR